MFEQLDLVSNTLFTLLLILNHFTFEILLLDDNYSSWMITTRYSYHPVLSFDVWLLWDRIIIIKKVIVNVTFERLNVIASIVGGSSKS